MSEDQRILTVGSLFAGIGGFDLGFERAGFEISWQVEIDDWCHKVLKNHFPSTKRFKDIRHVTGKYTVGKWKLAPVDVICGGFPCQPFSGAGKRGGAEDDRYLWPEMLRVISELRPSWVVAENVYGLTVGKMEPIFEQVLSDLEGEGYEVQPFIIPACAVDAPHRRDRVWIVAHAESERRAEARENFSGPKERITRASGKSNILANASSRRRGKQKEGKIQQPRRAETISAGSSPDIVGNADSQGLEKRERGAGSREALGIISGSGDNVANTHRKQLQRRGVGQLIHEEKRTTKEGEEERKRRGNSPGNSRKHEPYSWHAPKKWEVERPVGRVVNGLSSQLDKDRRDALRGLGNAIIPQIAEIFAHIINECEGL